MTAVRMPPDLNACKAAAIHQKFLYGANAMRQCLLLTCVIGSLAMVGCGGSDSGGSDGSDEGQASKSEFIAQADEICKSAAEETASLESRFVRMLESSGSAQETKEAANLLNELIVSVKQQVDQLARLEPPTSDTKEIDAYIAAIENRISLEQAVASALEENNKARTNNLAKEVVAAGKKSSEIGQRFGFKVCSAGGDGGGKGGSSGTTRSTSTEQQ